MKIQTAIILIFCVILSSCTKKEIIDEIQVIEIPEAKSSFDEEFYQRVNHYFSLYVPTAYDTIDSYRVYGLFQLDSTFNRDKIKKLDIYETNELNKDLFVSQSFKYENGCVVERKYYTNSYPMIYFYDNEKRKIKVSVMSEDNALYEYFCDYENNTYTRIEDNKDKVIIKKTGYGYELRNEKKHDNSIYKYFYMGKTLEKVEIYKDSLVLPQYIYNYKYLENRIVIQEMTRGYPENTYDYEEVKFLDNTIEIIQHADSNNSERRIVLSEFDQYDNWCLAEEYRDGKFYAKYKRVFEYIE